MRTPVHPSRPPVNRPALRRGALMALAAGAIGLTALAGPPARAAAQKPLRVCADPDNLPFSNAKGQGFENKLAEFVADQLGEQLSYTWWPWQRGRPRRALRAGLCDVVIGVPGEVGGVAATRPYYWSSYVFVSRADHHLGDISSIKDHRLKHLRIGVEEIHGNRFYTPPARMLADVGLADNLAAYPIEGPANTSPRARIIADVAQGKIDVAAVWGPVGGFFARQSTVPLKLVPIGDYEEFSTRRIHFGLVGFQFDIAMGVHPGNEALRRSLDQLIARDQPQITALLQRYGVPEVVLTRLAARIGRSGGQAE
ncbi:MAG TPA: quinoprotein dehydrogenase-associated putative ABC transporter substrate-binding protein [Stellaceae bacterium]|nr:quinoprotein dehydrogenase-associated putative ABC transporter substrate-binding protein [Stellaceae bacterium]